MHQAGDRDVLSREGPVRIRKNRTFEAHRTRAKIQESASRGRVAATRARAEADEKRHVSGGGVVRVVGIAGRSSRTRETPRARKDADATCWRAAPRVPPRDVSSSRFERGERCAVCRADDRKTESGSRIRNTVAYLTGPRAAPSGAMKLSRIGGASLPDVFVATRVDANPESARKLRVPRTRVRGALSSNALVPLWRDSSVTLSAIGHVGRKKNRFENFERFGRAPR